MKVEAINIQINLNHCSCSFILHLPRHFLYSVKCVLFPVATEGVYAPEKNINMQDFFFLKATEAVTNLAQLFLMSTVMKN